MHEMLYSGVRKMMNTPGRVNTVYVMPRGHAKSTIVTLGLPLWCVCYEKRHHIPIISDSHDQAKEQLATFKDEIENNARIIEDFGELKGPIWQKDNLVTANKIKLVALGSGMKIRGRKFGQYRPDLIILDDIENIKGAASATARESLKAWFYRSVVRAGWDDTKIVVVGNFLHYDCLLADMVQNPMFESYVSRALESWPDRMDMWDRWRDKIVNLNDPNKETTAKKYFMRNEKKMLAGAKSAWPEAFPVYDLMTIRVSDGEASFSMELQNEPIDPEKRLFKSWGLFRREMRSNGEWLIPLSGRAACLLKDCTIFGFTDPSMGKTTSSDYSALIILARAPTNQLFVLEADIQRRLPDRIMADQIQWAAQYNITTWGVESNKFQALLATMTARKSMEQAVYLPIVPVPQQGNKALRIQSLQPDLENRYILLNELGQDLLKQQLERYPATSYDDGPDALEGARTLARKWEPLSGAEIVQGDVHQFSSRRAHRRQPEDKWDLMDELADQTIYEHRLQQRAEIMKKFEGEEREAALAKVPLPKKSEPIFVPKMFT